MTGVAAQRAKLDARSPAHARNWRLERMAAVDRNVLRLAAYELLLHRHAGRGGDRRGRRARARLRRRCARPRFVNGVLDALAREARRSAR